MNDSKCIAQRIDDVFAKFQSGNSGLNLIPIDPLKIDKMDIVQGRDSPINIILNFKNIDFIGSNLAKVKSVNGFVENPTKMDMNFKAPVLSLVGPYKINGKVLILPIQGDGHSNITIRKYFKFHGMINFKSNKTFFLFLIENPDVKLRWTGKLVEKNGKKHYQIEKMKVNFEATRMIVNFSNLFNGDKALGDNMNLFLNENWSDILRELKPSITSAFAKIFKGTIGKVFDKIPYEELFA